MNKAVLEFRVLSGTHRHAHCLAEDGAVVGSDVSCDIVLADPGLAARAGSLRIGEHGWALESDSRGATGERDEDSAATGTGDVEPTLLPFNQPLALGSVWITVARSQDNWLHMPEAANDAVSGTTAAAGSHADTDQASSEDVSAGPHAESPGDTGTDDPQAGAAETADQAAPAAVHSTTSALAGPIKHGMGRPAWTVLGVAVTAIIVVIIIVLLLPRHAPAPPAKPYQTAQATISEITGVIERLGLDSRVHVLLSPAGTISVEGWVRNHDEQDNLAAALSQVWPRPAMRVSNESQAVRTAQFTLDAFNIMYTPRYEGQGRLEVDGIASSARERASAMDALKAQLPGMNILAGRIVLASDVTLELSERLARAGLSGIALSWQADRLQADAATLDAPRLVELQAVLEDFNAQYFDVVTIAHAVSQPVSDSVPFQIRSVVSGPQPFIVLGDGTKIIEGGNYMGFVLEKVEAGRVIFGGVRSAIIIR